MKMELDVNKKHSPCSSICYIQGQRYSPDDPVCQRCEYNIAVQLLKLVLKTDCQCELCNNRIDFGGGHFECRVTGKDDCICDTTRYFSINLKRAFEKYDRLKEIHLKDEI